MKVETIGVKLRGKSDDVWRGKGATDSRRWQFYLEVEFDAREMDSLFIHSKEGSPEHGEAGDKIVKELNRAWVEECEMGMAYKMYKDGQSDEDKDKNDSEDLGEEKDR